MIPRLVLLCLSIFLIFPCFSSKAYASDNTLSQERNKAACLLITNNSSLLSFFTSVNSRDISIDCEVANNVLTKVAGEITVDQLNSMSDIVLNRSLGYEAICRRFYEQIDKLNTSDRIKKFLYILGESFAESYKKTYMETCQQSFSHDFCELNAKTSKFATTYPLVAFGFKNKVSFTALFRAHFQYGDYGTKWTPRFKSFFGAMITHKDISTILTSVDDKQIESATSECLKEIQK